MVNVKCMFFIGPEEYARKYKVGGNPEGSLDLYVDRIEVFEKSKVVTYAFGAIGRAIEGKGKAIRVIPTDTIINYRKVKNNKYMIYLQDGYVLYVNLTGLSKSDSIKEMDNYLNYIMTKKNVSSKINQNNVSNTKKQKVEKVDINNETKCTTKIESNWKCVECGTSNAGKFCIKCGHERPKKEKPVNVNKVPNDLLEGTKGTTKIDGNWKCVECGTSNAGKFCIKCGHERPKKEKPVNVNKISENVIEEKKNTTKKEEIESNWKCVECGTSNAGKFCIKCGHERPKKEKPVNVNKISENVIKEKKNTTKKEEIESNWKCVECGTSNTGKFCLNCGHERPKKEKPVNANKISENVIKEKKNTTKKEKTKEEKKSTTKKEKPKEEKKSTTKKEKKWKCIECGTSNTGNFCINCGQEKQKEKKKTEDWICDRCNTSNIGKFCSNCGQEKPKKEEKDNNWVCNKCNTSNTGKFCSNCGQEKPKKEEKENNWVCDKCNTSNTGNFCINCGQAKPNKVGAIEEPWVCYSCGTYNVGKYCKRCGNKKSEDEHITEDKLCNVCGQKVDKDNLYCNHCGSPII